MLIAKLEGTILMRHQRHRIDQSLIMLKGKVGWTNIYNGLIIPKKYLKE